LRLKLKRNNSPLRKTLEDACNLAKEKNGYCLSDKYKNNSTKMLWKCGDCYNEWMATYNMIQRGTWCPRCAKIKQANKKRLIIDTYKKVAKNKGGELLSIEYNSCFEKLKWRCKNGHEFELRADQAKNTNRWCKYCNKKKNE